MGYQAAFEKLKWLFAAKLTLRHPNPAEPSIIYADASNVAAGAVLLQKNERRKLQPCTYTSQEVTDTERRWTVWAKETYVVLTSRQFLEGSKVPFEVCLGLKNLGALKTPRKLTPKQVRWAEYFNRFNFTLQLSPLPVSKKLP